MKDQRSNIIVGGTVVVTESGGTTAATTYESETGDAQTSYTSDSSGKVEFWVDNGDYTSAQRFRITASKTGFSTVIEDDIAIIGTFGDVTLTGAETITNKEIDGDNNTISNLAIGAEVLATPVSDINMNGFNIDNGGVIFLKEQAEADGPVAGSGQIWVDTATPNVLYFTDDADTDFRLSYTNTGTGNNVLATSPTIATPTIASFANATHDHSDAAGGGLITRNYLSGMGTSVGIDADHDIDVAAGECIDNDNDTWMALSAITKQIDASWVVGTGNGGLSSSLTVANDTWYHVHVVIVSGVVDVGFDTSVTAANLVTDHSATAYRRIGSVLTNGSANIIGFTQVGDEFLWNTVVNDYAVTSPGTSAVTRTLTVPTGVKVLAKHVYASQDSTPVGEVIGLISSLDQSDTVPSTTLFHTQTGATAERASVEVLVRTNISSQVRTRINSSNADIHQKGITLGWIDHRNKDV
jgi:hypothetical protein